MAAKRKPAKDAAPPLPGPTPTEVSLAQARRAFAALDRETQFRMAQEIVQLRERELRLVYRNLVGIGFGYRARGGDGKRALKLDRTVCVTFIVSAKWKARKPQDPQHLPRFMFAYATAGNERVLCAVPTDVRPKAHYGKPQAHADDAAPFGILVDRKDWPKYAIGNMSCRIVRPDFPGEQFALSCRHVFSRSLLDTSEAAGNGPVLSGEGSLSRIGLTTKTRGPLIAAPATSFDAQLARVEERDALGIALEGLRFDPHEPYAKTQAAVESGFWVATPRPDVNGSRVLVWVDFHGVIMNQIVAYPFPAGRTDVAHRWLIHGVATDRLMPGDSGSPAVRTRSGNRLFGMYIGGDGANAYFIPSWELFKPANYGITGESNWTMAAP